MTEVTTWYQRGQGQGFFRNLYWAWFLSAAYFLIAFAPFGVVAYHGYDKDSVIIFAQSLWALGWGFLVSVGYPLWKWAETRAFERWALKQSPDVQERERRYFAVMTECSKNFWTAVIATYTIAGLWTIALGKG